MLSIFVSLQFISLVLKSDGCPSHFPSFPEILLGRFGEAWCAIPVGPWDHPTYGCLEGSPYTNSLFESYGLDQNQSKFTEEQKTTKFVNVQSN